MAEKSKYVILIDSQKISFYKIDEGCMKPIKVTYENQKVSSITSQISLTKRFFDFNFSKDRAIDYPTYVYHFYDELIVSEVVKAKCEHVTNHLCELMQRSINLLKNDYAEKKEIYCFTSVFTVNEYDFDYSLINYKITDSDFKKTYTMFLELTILLEMCLCSEPSFYIATNDMAFTFQDEKFDMPCFMTAYCEEIEEIIRNKYYFLYKFDNKVINKIVDAFFYETLKENRNTECVFQDISIVFTEEDYKKIEEIIFNSYYNSIVSFFEKSPNGIFIDFTESPVTKRLFKAAIEKANIDINKVINIFDLIPLLCEYHKISYLGSNYARGKTKETNTYRFRIVTEEGLKRAKLLTNDQKLQISSKLKLLKKNIKLKIGNVLDINKVEQK